MSTLRIFIVLSVLSCILFWVYQIYVLGLINRPNTYSASSSVFLIHVFGLMYLANLNEKKTIAKKYLPTYHKALIIFCGMLSGTGKIVLFFPMLLNLRFSFFRLPILAAFFLAIVFLLRRSPEEIFRSLSERVNYMQGGTEVLHSTFYFLTAHFGFELLPVIFLLAFTFFSVAIKRLDVYYAGVYIIFISFLMEFQLFGDNSFSSSVLVVIVFEIFSGVLGNGAWRRTYVFKRFIKPRESFR